MANYNFFTDVTGKKVKVSDLQSNIPCYFSTSDSAISLNSYYETANNGVAQTTMTFKGLSVSAKDVNVTAYGLYSNGKKTNIATTQIQLRNALQGIKVTSLPKTVYTGGGSTILVGALNENVYGLNGSFEVTLSATLGTIDNKTFIAPKSLASVSSQNVTITAKAAAGKYSATEKTGTATIEVRQAVTDITTGSLPTFYVGDGAKTFTYTLVPTNCYNKGVILENTTTYYTASASNGNVTITPKAAGTAYFTLKSADGKVSKSLQITISNRGTASITVNSTSKTLNPNQVDSSITVSSTGCASLSASSNSTSVATATISNNKLVITAGTTAGNATITISGTPNTGYTAPANKTVNVTVKNISISVV